MENQIYQEQTSKTALKKMSESTTFRMVLIGALTLVLMIPISYVNDLIQEREVRKSKVIDKINSSWGSDAIIYGPLMKIPYKVYNTTIVYNSKGEKTKNKVFVKNNYIYVFPEELNIISNIDTHKKKLGIYETSVYKSKNSITGHFIKPDISKLKIDKENVDWKNTKILFFTANNKGIENRMQLTTQHGEYDFSLMGDDFVLKTKKMRVDESGIYHNSSYSQVFFKNFATGSLEKNPFENKNVSDFSMEYNVKGSNSLQAVPLGKETRMKINSNWPDPGFFGEFLPDDKTITSKGFTADWKIIDYQRPFKQVYLDELPNFSNYAFGVALISTVDEYTKNDRASKYAFLVVFLTFLLFFIIQYIGKIQIHYFQYFLIGLALVIFYVLLISFSEHINFNTSYIIASFATISLISLYSKAILKSKKFVLYILSSLSLLYIYIFVIIQLEDYALLVGSIGLFLILAMIMYFSRKIEW